VAAGIPDELYDQCTPPEREALLVALAKREERRGRDAMYRAAFIVSAIYNVNRKKGKRALKPEDFLKAKTRVLSPAEMADVMSSWADAHNQKVEA
jgi:hypothetical protein